MSKTELDIRIDDLSSPEVVSLLQSHLEGMQSQTPPESVHALDLGDYQSAGLTLWTVWDGGVLMGCGALKDLGVLYGERRNSEINSESNVDNEGHSERHGEIKTMRTVEEHLRKGVADAVLTSIIDHAKSIGMKRLSLETGRTELFTAAQQFYLKRGFVETSPFADYTNDPHSMFLTLAL